jgi:hypothetical protein
VDLLGRLHLLLCAAERIEELPADLAGDVRTALGWTQSKDDALNAEGIDDCWNAVGQVIEEEERFRVVRTWLVGQRTGRRALILDFTHGSQPLDRSIAPGSAFHGALAFYPSRQPLRAVLKSRAESPAIAPDITRGRDVTIETGLQGYAEALASNPWIIRWPLVLAGIRLVDDAGRWFLVDEHDRGLPVRAAFTRSLQLWRLVSTSSGSPMTVVAEWDGVSALPIAAFGDAGSGYVDLSPRWAA